MHRVDRWRPGLFALLTSGKFRGRAGASLFGPDSPSWQEKTQVSSFKDRREFAETMTPAWARALGISGAAEKTLHQIVGRWIAEFPDDLWQRPMDNLDRWGALEVERVRKAARLQLKFYENLRRSLPLTNKQLAFLRELRTIIVPYRRK